MTEERIAEIVSQAVKSEMSNHFHCAAQGLSNEEVVMLRRVIRVLDQTAVSIGRAIVTAVVTGIIGLIVYGFYHKVN